MELPISYLTKEVKEIFNSLPPFASITQWTKTLKGVLMDFTFMNLLIYLVYGRDTTFNMDSLKAFKWLKAYKYFHDGYVKNDKESSNEQTIIMNNDAFVCNIQLDLTPQVKMCQERTKDAMMASNHR